MRRRDPRNALCTGHRAGRPQKQVRKVEVNCPNCGITLDIYPVDMACCYNCECLFDMQTGRILATGKGDDDE